MKKNTSKDYQDAIKEKYVKERKGMYAAYLADPTPSLLKQLAILRSENADQADKIILQFFFNTKESVGAKYIENFDGDKIKPLCNFLKGKTASTRPTSLELLALLVDYRPRPLSKFLQSHTALSLVPIPLNEMETAKDMEITPVNEAIVRNRSTNKKAIMRKTLIVMLLFMGIAFITYSLLEKKCMIWVKDHYEETDCENDIHPLMGSGTIIPLDKETLRNQRKVRAGYGLAYFTDDGKPCVWYSRHRDSLELFTYPGLHPVSGETLKPITLYMINKYLAIRPDTLDH